MLVGRTKELVDENYLEMLTGRLEELVDEMDIDTARAELASLQMDLHCGPFSPWRMRKALAPGLHARARGAVGSLQPAPQLCRRAVVAELLKHGDQVADRF